MAAITATQRADLVALFLTMFGKAPTTVQLARMVTAYENGTSLLNIGISASTILESDFALVASMDADSFATYLTNALLASDTPTAAREWATNWVVTQVQGNKSKAQVIVEAVQAIRATTNTNYASAQAELAADVTATLNTIDNPTAAPSSLTLTTGADNFTGQSGNDVFNASISSSTMTFDALDSLDGGAGNDTLNVSVNGTGTYQAASVKNIETINLNASAAGTISLLGTSGVTTVNANGSTAAATFSNIGSTSVALKVTNTNQNATFGYTTAATSGTADSASLTLSNVTGGTVTVNGIETLNLASTSGANNVTLVAGAATTLNVTGDQNLTLGTAPATITKVGAADFTGALSLTMGAAGTVDGGSGNDTITMGAAAAAESVNGGAGNDTITFGANLSNTDTINGGDGTDTLSTTSALATGYTKPTTATISNIETLTISDQLAGDLTVTNLGAGITRVNLTTGTDGTARAVTMEAGDVTVSLGAALGNTLTVNDTGTATTDSLTLLNSASATNVTAGASLTVAGYETVTFNGSGTGAATTQTINVLSHTADTGGTATFKITGSNSVTLTGAATTGVLDASGLTGTAVLTMNTAPTSITSILGSDRADTLRGDASSSIDGGAGNDSITGGTGNDTLVGGAGADTITTDTGSDSVSGGDGNDVLVFAGNLATGDIIDGGAGDDTLSVSNTSLTTVAGYSLSTVVALNDKVSNVERLLVSDALDQTSFDVARVDGINYITLAGGWTGAESLIGLGANSTIRLLDGESTNTVANALTVTYSDATGTADVVNIALINDNSTNFEAVTLSSIETVNLSTAEVTATTTAETHTLKMNLTGVTKLVVTGTESVDLTSANIGATTIDASGLADTVGTPNIKVTGNSANQSFIGSAGADTIDGGAGADTIDGGAGADSLVGGSGVDSITGGNGADTITGGAGNDTIVLTETVAAVDDVIVNYSEAGANIDTVIGFATGSTGDEIQLSLSALEAAGTSGIFSSATNFSNLNAATDAAAGAATVQVLTGATTVGAATVFALQGATFSTADEVEDALEAGGSFALTVAAAADVADKAFVVVYSNGVDTKVAAVHIVSADGNTAFETGNLNVIDLVTLTGVSSIGASTFATANFEWIA